MYQKDISLMLTKFDDDKFVVNETVQNLTLSGSFMNVGLINLIKLIFSNLWE